MNRAHELFLAADRWAADAPARAPGARGSRVRGAVGRRAAPRAQQGREPAAPVARQRGALAALASASLPRLLRSESYTVRVFTPHFTLPRYKWAHDLLVFTCRVYWTSTYLHNIAQLHFQ